jgi:hypothetical protein
MALCFRLVLAVAPHCELWGPTLDYFLPPQPNSAFRWNSASTFEGHSEASDVLRELFKVIQILRACQGKRRSFLPIGNLLADRNSRPELPTAAGQTASPAVDARSLNPVRTAQNIKTTGRPTTGAEHSAPEL